MANKQELASELEQLTGDSVDPDAFTKAELEEAIGDAKAAAEGDLAADQAQAQADASVSVVLGAKARIGRLMVGRVAIERDRAGRIPRSDFERLKDAYGLEEAKG